MNIIDIKQYPVGHMPFTNAGREAMEYLMQESRKISPEDWVKYRVGRKIENNRWVLYAKWLSPTA